MVINFCSKNLIGVKAKSRRIKTISLYVLHLL